MNKNCNSKVTVAMITLNEEKAIDKVVNDIKKVLPDAEILIVDSSSDRTAQIAEELGCNVIKQYPPKGYGPAMEKALLSANGDIIITMDCDDTYPAESIPNFIEWINKGYDIVNGSRLMKRPEAMPYSNYVANRLFGSVASILFGIKIRDVHSGMRAYRRELIHNIKWDANHPALPVELLLIPIQKGYKFKDINIDYKPRIGETTLHRISSTYWTFKRIFKLRFFRGK